MVQALSFDPFLFLKEVEFEREKDINSRIGQAAWHVACDMYRETIRKYSVDLKEIDCYYDDSRLPYLLAFLASRVK